MIFNDDDMTLILYLCAVSCVCCCARHVSKSVDADLGKGHKGQSETTRML